MSETTTVLTKLIENLPAILAALAGCLAYFQSRRNGIKQDSNQVEVAALAVKTAKDVATVVTARSDAQDQKLNDIHTNTDQINTNTDKIYTNTNGNLDRLRADLKLANDKIAQLHELVERLLANKEQAPRSGRIGDPKP